MPGAIAPDQRIDFWSESLNGAKEGEVIGNSWHSRAVYPAGQSD